MPAIETMSTFVLEDYADRSREAEQLARDVIGEGRIEFSTAEKAHLAREMNWDERQCRDELRRVRNVSRLQGIAGRPEDRAATSLECQTATDLLAKQGPILESKISELQTRLEGLRRDSRLSEKRVEEQTLAVQQLREVCPVAIVDGVNRERRALEAGVGQDLRDSKSRHHELMCNLNLNNVYESKEKHIEYGLLRSLPAAVAKIVVNQILRYDYSAEWPSLKAKCAAEYAAITEKLPELQSVYDDAVQVSEMPLNFYTNQPAS